VSFEWPFVLVALLVLPLLAAWYVRAQRQREERAAAFASPTLLPNLVPDAPGARRHVPFALFLVALALLLVGAARPHADVTVRREEATVVLAVDTSRSMAARDVRPTRLDAARGAAERFLERVPPRYRVGVVSFGSRATPALPPTTDRELARASLRALRPGLGTVLGDGVALAVRMGRRPRDEEGRSPPAAVLLVSDGANEGGRVSPAAAARRARARRVPIYTVVVGTPRGVVRRTVQGGFVETVRVPARPDTLRVLAETTRGRFFTVRTDDGLREVYERLGSQLGRRTTSREITDLFAAASAALLVAGGALSAVWLQRMP
jgi:Ca-activated chloride channel family protein